MKLSDTENGNLKAACTAIPLGQLYYWTLEEKKIEALKRAKGDFDEKMTLKQEAAKEIISWIKNIRTTHLILIKPNIGLTIRRNTCASGWGGAGGEGKVEGILMLAVKLFYIYALEMLTIQKSL